MPRSMDRSCRSVGRPVKGSTHSSCEAGGDVGGKGTDRKVRDSLIVKGSTLSCCGAGGREASVKGSTAAGCMA